MGVGGSEGEGSKSASPPIALVDETRMVGGSSATCAIAFTIKSLPLGEERTVACFS